MKSIRFDNRVLRRLPIDAEKQNFVREVKNACFSLVKPTPLRNPSLVAVSPSALALLGLPTHITQQVAPSSAQPKEKGDGVDTADATLVDEMREDLVRFLSGAELMEGSEPASHCYCGHQFGSFAGQLGDGAAIYLGEVVAPQEGDSSRRWELQLKGAGLTPYSRTADGRKVLRSSLREFIASEFMASAGVPTTRAGTLITSDSRIPRDPVYDGSIVMERCSVISRIAETFIRFGSFEICKAKDSSSSRAGPSAGNPEILSTLFTYIAEEFFPEIAQKCKKESEDSAAVEAKATKKDGQTKSENTVQARKSWQELACTRIFAEICRRTAELVAKWQGLGWVHGVLNTDNMSIVGLTIDYGPYGFMSYFDNDHVSNLSDHTGRYSYKQQPAMCQWNLGKLAEAWELIFPDQKQNFDAIITEYFGGTYNQAYTQIMASKLGIDYEKLIKSSSDKESELDASDVEDTVMEIIGELVFALQTTGAEFTNTFNLLKKAKLALGSTSRQEEEDTSVASAIANLCISPSARQKIIKRRVSELKPSMHPQQVQQLIQIARVNPERLKEIFNDNVQPEEMTLFLEEENKKIQASQQLQSEFAHWIGVSSEDKKKQDTEKWKNFIAEYRKCITKLRINEETRRLVMSKANPVFVPFPWVLQEAIVQAEDGQYSLVRNLLDRCMHPFEEDPRDGVLWSVVPPEDSEDICVSCSS